MRSWVCIEENWSKFELSMPTILTPGGSNLTTPCAR